MKESINIIGAGPAGLTAAIVLRQNGLPVTIFEQHEEVGWRFHDDHQGLENWSSKKDILDEFSEIGLNTDFEYEPFTEGVVLASAGGNPTRIRFNRPLFYLVRRGPRPGSLDMALKEQALFLGARIVFNNRVALTNNRTIIATGPRGGGMIAAGYTFESDSDKMVAVIFDDKIAPKGYAYILINGGRGTMASMIFRNFPSAKRYRDEALIYFKERMAIDFRNETEFTGYGSFYIGDTQVCGGNIYVGEAAGFQDFLWGFGIRYAVRSGYLAAKSVIEGIDYDTLWKSRLKPLLETSAVNRFIFEKLGQAGYKYITNRLARGNGSEFLREHYNPSLLKTLLRGFAPARYKRWKTRRNDINDTDMMAGYGDRGNESGNPAFSDK